MAKTFTPKPLAEGQLPNAKTTLYTCPASTSAYIKFISLVAETGAVGETVVIYYKKSGSTSRVIARGILNSDESIRVLDAGETLEMSEGDVIEGQSTTAATIDYVISGVEEAT